ncbi:MAG: GNAT family N-acetyltransferase [Thermoplasmatota archaeon]
MGSDASAALEEVRTEKDLYIERKIRERVFIEEQGVPRDIEYDEHEQNSIHFLIKKNGVSVGCIRYRWNGSDIKIERLAVLKEHRKKGLGGFAMKNILQIALRLGPDRIYLHSQTAAREFYEKIGFGAIGPRFTEAGIEHIKMYWKGGEER